MYLYIYRFIHTCIFMVGIVIRIVLYLIIDGIFEIDIIEVIWTLFGHGEPPPCRRYPPRPRPRWYSMAQCVASRFY